jgi:alginate O-acetyltransferase complex protein AlgI
MLFTSPVFLLAFLPITWAGFRLIDRFSSQWANVWLVVASLYFYAWWDWRYVFLLALSVAGNHLAGRAIAAVRDRPVACRALVIAAVGANLAALSYFKYLAAVVGFLIGHGLPVPDPGPIILPLGISFFTFTQIAFLVDVSWGEADERDPVSYALFVTFFPHLLAGPILHHAEMMPQFAKRESRGLNGTDLAVGISIFIFGLAKKTLLADMVAINVGWGFEHTGQVQFFTAWKATLSYSLQLYFDFSGYTDMAIGLARMFSIRFPLNFNSPYKARSVIEYWQRWHMTLTRYLTRYIYNPMALWLMHVVSARRRLQGIRMTRMDRFLSMMLVPVITTMTIAGVWHGAGLQFLVFGLLHGIYLSVNHAWRFFRTPAGSPNVTARVGSCLLTYGCVLIGATFFRAASVEDALRLLAAMIGLHGAESPLPVPGFVVDALGVVLAPLLAHGMLIRADVWSMVPAGLTVAWLALLYAIVWGMPNTQQILMRYRPALGWSGVAPRWVPSFRLTPYWSLVIGALAALAVILRQRSEFIYYQF